MLAGHTQPVSSPYAAGSLLTLRLGEPCDGQLVTAEITKVFEPFTLSCVMIVNMNSQIPNLNGTFVLKLFDRRFTPEYRDDHCVPPWSPHVEQEYQDFILNGGAAELVDKLNSNRIDVEEHSNSWSHAQFEAYLHNHMRALYKTEVRVYKALEDLQGKSVPRLFACVAMPSSTGYPSSVSDFIDTPGFFMEYIEGFSLLEVKTRVPKDAWSSLAESAIRVVNTIMDRGILNTDVKERNFVVDPQSFEVRMIDFGNCEFRDEYEDEIDWKRAQAEADEEGAVAVPLESKLRGEFVWVQSARTVELSQYLPGEEDLGQDLDTIFDEQSPVKGAQSIVHLREAPDTNEGPKKNASCNGHSDQTVAKQNSHLNGYEELRSGIQLLNCSTSTATTDTSRTVSEASLSSNLSTASTLFSPISQSSGSSMDDGLPRVTLEIASNENGHPVDSPHTSESLQESQITTPAQEAANNPTPSRRLTIPLTPLIMTKKPSLAKEVALRSVSGQSNSSNDSPVDSIFSPASSASGDREFLKEEFEAIQE